MKLHSPVQAPYRITSPYGSRILNGKKEMHEGIDYVSKTGLKDVFAITDGLVVYDKDNYDHKLRWTKGHSAGNMVIIKHIIDDKNYYVRYLHLGDNRISKGDRVVPGQYIGYYGDYGYSFGAHLHVDVFDMKWVKFDFTSLFGKIALSSEV